MLFNLSTFFVIVCLCKSGLCAETLGRLFSQSGAYVTAGSRSEYTITVDSETLCAVLCYSDEICATFEYNKSTKLCRMSAGLLSGAKYGPHVDSAACSDGYQVYVREKNVLCLKYYLDSITQIAATARCATEGARLILIQNESMNQFVGDILTTYVGGDVWVNGFDEDDDGNYTTIGRKPLPYVPPGSSMHLIPGEQCIRFRTADYVFSDLPCNASSLAWAQKKVLCEIVA